MVFSRPRSSCTDRPEGLEGGAVRGMSRTADVVIIGGGIQGASIAYHLTQRGQGHVVILEKDTLASGRTGGMIRQHYSTDPVTGIETDNGRLIAELILDGRPSLDIEPLSFERFATGRLLRSLYKDDPIMA